MPAHHFHPMRLATSRLRWHTHRLADAMEGILGFPSEGCFPEIAWNRFPKGMASPWLPWKEANGFVDIHGRMLLSDFDGFC